MAHKEEMNIVIKNITSALSLKLYIIQNNPHKEMEGKALHVSRVSAK